MKFSEQQLFRTPADLSFFDILIKSLLLLWGHCIILFYKIYHSDGIYHIYHGIYHIPSQRREVRRNGILFSRLLASIYLLKVNSSRYAVFIVNFGHISYLFPNVCWPCDSVLRKARQLISRTSLRLNFWTIKSLIVFSRLSFS